MADVETESIYDIKVTNIDGKELALDEYKGKTLLIVNVASECGFTPQYEGLQNIYEKYQDKEFVVLGFPCNQFGGQEPGSREEIKQFCSTKFSVDFPLFEKIDVNGDNAHQLYKYLKASKGGFPGDAIKWNFTKFLVDKNGKVVGRYGSQKTPSSLESEIEQIL
ncbi:glutathione peroxidase [Candidatus Kapabacteria bacterium]|nr:glutathione peroxidase [Candidatus Kapabacteria bacterium]